MDISPFSPRFRPSQNRNAALLDLHGVGFFQLSDSLTGYGRDSGYDSLANARRAAYQLSHGEDSPAAGIYESAGRFFVRALVAAPGKSPHAAGDSTATAPARTGAELLHFEGNDEAHFAWVRDRRLLMLVDGSTKIFSRDAHHRAPRA